MGLTFKKPSSSFKIPHQESWWFDWLAVYFHSISQNQPMNSPLRTRMFVWEHTAVGEPKIIPVVPVQVEFSFPRPTAVIPPPSSAPGSPCFWLPSPLSTTSPRPLMVFIASFCPAACSLLVTTCLLETVSLGPQIPICHGGPGRTWYWHRPLQLLQISDSEALHSHLYNALCHVLCPLHPWNMTTPPLAFCVWEGRRQRLVHPSAAVLSGNSTHSPLSWLCAQPGKESERFSLPCSILFLHS